MGCCFSKEDDRFDANEALLPKGKQVAHNNFDHVDVAKKGGAGAYNGYKHPEPTLAGSHSHSQQHRDHSHDQLHYDVAAKKGAAPRPAPVKAPTAVVESVDLLGLEKPVSSSVLAAEAAEEAAAIQRQLQHVAPPPAPFAPPEPVVEAPAAPSKPASPPKPAPVAAPQDATPDPAVEEETESPPKPLEREESPKIESTPAPTPPAPATAPQDATPVPANVVEKTTSPPKPLERKASPKIESTPVPTPAPAPVSTDANDDNDDNEDNSEKASSTASSAPSKKGASKKKKKKGKK